MKENFKIQYLLNKHIFTFVLLLTSLVLFNPTLLTYAQDNVEYDHYYKWEEEGIKMGITVKGKVSYEPKDVFKIKINPNCNIGEDSYYVYTLEGEGNVTAKGEAVLGDDPEDLVYMTFEVPVKVKIKGKSSFPFLHELEGCTEIYNLQLEETWTENVKWDLQSDDPEADAYAESLLPSTLGGNHFKMDKKTLEFITFQRFKETTLELEEEAFMNMGFPMKGKIRYKVNLTKSDYTIGGVMKYDDDKSINPYEEYAWPKLHWGPPLDQIKWDVIPEDK